MKKIISVCLFFAVFPGEPLFAQSEEFSCHLSYLTASDLSNFRSKGSTITSLSRSINEILKSSYSFVNLVDRYTLGLASTLTLGTVLGTTHSFEDLKPHQWNKIHFVGNLIYKDSPHTVIPIKRAQITVSSEKNSEILTSGPQGEYSFPFYKIVPYERFRLFPLPMFERKMRLEKTIDIPISIEVESKVCNGKVTLSRLPIEPITLILSKLESLESLE